ncbi:IPP transferase-domain-containing protein [Phaeosphaeriaceae sp. PMI808]|nr:IPP transferase-domain-containing protein [Phaeosphaeriaceae sp. PMI808]
MAKTSLDPLIAVVGATGTGKSDLAVEIARKFNGEIINGDAMQLYQGLPIITNQITPEEMKTVPHHLLGCIGLQEETWAVGKFVGKALGVIDDIRSRGKIPVLVGGTHYYTQSLLFQDTLSDEPSLDLSNSSNDFPILQESTDIILAKLKEVDPLMADRWHPNERRKIQRSLEIYLRTGKPASQIYGEQRMRQERRPSIPDGARDARDTGMRFPTLVFWVHANKDVLYPRLDSRIGKMLEKGLLQEVEKLTRSRNEEGTRTGITTDQSRGIWVSIGYKEFLNYQSKLADNKVHSEELERIKLESIERMQAATRQFANRQIKWIRIKLLNAFARAGQRGNVFLLDGTDLSKWEDDVVQPAVRITDQFLSGHTLQDPSSLSATALEMLVPKRSYDLGQRPDLWQKRTCDTCGIVAVTENDWSLHNKSRAHRRAVGLEKKQKNSKQVVEQSREALQADTVDVLESYIHTFPDNEATG